MVKVVLVIVLAIGCGAKNLEDGVGGAGGAGGSTAGTFVSCGGVAGTLPGTGGGPEAGGDNGLLFASAGGYIKGDPCTNDGCPETLATSYYPGQLKVDEANLYWTSSRSIVRMPFGGAMETIALNLNPESTFAIDATDLYWVRGDEKAIVKTPLAGGPPITLVERSNAFGLVVDATNLYWTERVDCGSVMKIAKTGGAASAVVSGHNWPGAPAIDATSLYWHNDVAPASLMKVALTGGVPVELLPHRVWGFVVGRQAILWSDGVDIMKMPLDGGPSIKISTEPVHGFSADGTTVFYGRAGGSLMSIPIDGGMPKVLSNYQYPLSIAVDAAAVYWTSAHNTVMKIPRR